MTQRPEATGESSLAVIGEPALSPGGMLDARVTARVCPYLLAAGGDWRSAMPTKEHRCTALEPPAYLSLDKQRRVCLTDSHSTCATYVAARQALRLPDESGASDHELVTDAGAELVAATAGDRGTASIRWPLPRTAPVILDRGRPSLRSMLVDRSVAQLGLALLMALAFVVLALARLSPAETGPVQTVGSPSPGLTGSAAPAASTSAAPSPSASSPGPASTASAPSSSTSAAPASAPASISARVYRVTSGDTLSGIAARFGVSVTALQRANGIQDPSLLRIGQLLIIP